MTTVTTVGYGDTTPTSALEEGLALGSMLAGALFLSFVISTLIELLASAGDESRRAERYVKKMALVDSWLGSVHLPGKLSSRIYRCACMYGDAAGMLACLRGAAAGAYVVSCSAVVQCKGGPAAPVLAALGSYDTLSIIRYTVTQPPWPPTPHRYYIQRRVGAPAGRAGAVGQHPGGPAQWAAHTGGGGAAEASV